MKNILVFTGGAGFVGSNLIKSLIKFKNFKILSIDNYSSGSKKNHIKNKNVKYIKNETYNISKILSKNKNKIHTLFHFGEFSSIYQSFKNFDKCFESNTIGTQEVFKFCLENKIKLIYSATSASLGNKGNDKNLSPYAFTNRRISNYSQILKNGLNLNLKLFIFIMYMVINKSQADQWRL